MGLQAGPQSPSQSTSRNPVFSDSRDIATWNLEHLNDTVDAGCVPREQADYDAIASRIREIAPDVVAFQEVENADAALKVFPATHWHVHSRRNHPRWIC